jgi:hypothetical protein
MSQLTMNFEPALPERFPTLRAYIAHRSVIVSKSLKTQAGDMDIAPSTLSRKLNPAEGDTQRFNLDDLEQWLASTGDASAVIEYLAAKYMDNASARRTRIADNAERLMTELASLLPQLRETS